MGSETVGAEASAVFLSMPAVQMFLLTLVGSKSYHSGA